MYRVTRYRNHPQFGDSLQLLKGRHPITAATVPETEKRLESIIGLSRAAFNNAFLFSQESEFYFSAFTDAQQKAVLRELLSLTVLKKAQQYAKDKYRQYDVQYNELVGRQEALEEELEELKEVYKEEKKQATVELKKIKQELTKVKKLRKLSEFDVKQLDKELTVLEVELNGLREASSTASSLRCHHCGYSVDCPRCKKVQAKAEMVSRSSKNVAATKTRMEKVRRRIKDCTRRKDESQRRLATCDQAIGRLSHAGITTRSGVNVGKTKRKVDALRSRISEGVECRSKANRYRTVYEYWQEGFGQQGVELFALQQAFPMLNSFLVRYLNVLFPGASLEYKVSEKGKITHKLSLPKLAKRIEGLSRGQRRRVDIAVGLALQELMSVFIGLTANVILLDEVFEGLDQAGINHVVRLLNALAGKHSSVFVVSHRRSLANQFTNVRDIDLVDGVSRFRK
jgi:DNA repair exonuclease SbcCD ATPase subunit